MDPFYGNHQQHQYQAPQQQHGHQFPGHNNASHNYFLHQPPPQQQQHFLQNPNNILQTGSGPDPQEQSFNNSTSPEGTYREEQQYRQATPYHGQENHHSPASGLLVPKVEVIEDQQHSTPSPASYSTPPAGVAESGPSSDPGTSMPAKENNDSYQCSICYESFPTAKTYKNHMANHKIPMTTYSNDATPTGPADVHLLREHILAHVREHPQFQLGAGPGPGGGDGGMLEKCQYCYKLFADRVQLQIHLKEHNALKEYKCLNCNKMYASLNYLKLHYKMHADEKPYRCTYCDKRFTFSSNLYVHHRIHTGHKPYRCEKCSKCFSQINSLKQHLRIHRDQPPAPTTLPTPPPVSAAAAAAAVQLLTQPGGPNGILPPLIAAPTSIQSQPQHQQHQQPLPQQHHLPQLHPHPPLLVPNQHQQQQHPKTKVLKSEFGDGTSDSELQSGNEEDNVPNMSSRTQNSGELSIQDVIIQQLQQRLVSQP